MGQEDEQARRLADFAGFQITADLLKRGGAKPDCLFMHCLPRHSYEVDDEVFYARCRALLAPRGVMAVNLFGRDASFTRSVGRIAATS